MRIGIDLDGVTYDFVGAFQRYYEAMHPGVTLPLWTKWNYWEQDDVAMTFEQWMSNLREGIRDERIFWRGMPVFGAVAGLKHLKAIGHEIHIVTHRSAPGMEQECRWATEHWLSEQRIPHDHLVIVQGNPDTKDKTGLDLDVLLDDRDKNCEAARDAGEWAICFDQLWNQSWDGPRVYSWGEFTQVIAAAS